MTNHRDVAECEFCDEDVWPFNRRAKYHVCTDCLKDRVRVGDRTPTHEINGEEIN